MFRMFRKKKGRNKYGNKRVIHNGEKFDSQKEFERWEFLKKAQENGEISELKRQVKFELLPSIREEYEVQLKTKTVTKTRVVQQAISYRCDFAYIKDGKQIIEDIKPSEERAAIDKVYILKKKMMKSLKGIDVKEVYKSDEQI